MFLDTQFLVSLVTCKINGKVYAENVMVYPHPLWATSPVRNQLLCFGLSAVSNGSFRCRGQSCTDFICSAQPWRFSLCADIFLINVTRHLFFCLSPMTCPSVEAPQKVIDFATELPRAVMNHDTLELVSGTFFLGDSSYGSKLFIRPCYRELSELLLLGASSDTMRNIVVTGTPGIGKSVFGFYLLYLLRRQGKTVVYDSKGDWYRFSDEGVAKGELSDFKKKRYLDNDEDNWCLSDPESRPYEGFTGTTVVLVSPKAVRVHEFMKQEGSCRCFMPVWSLDELFECQRAVFPHVPKTDVRKRFGKVGGVARAVFNVKKLQEVCRRMQTAASNMDLSVLQQILSRGLGDVDQVSTDRSGDALLHLMPVPGTGFEEFSVNFASEYAHDLTTGELPKKEFAALAGFVRAAFTNDELGAKVVAERAAGFEIIAHKTIVGADEQQLFDMRILSSANSSTESELEGDSVRFNFLKEESFEGNSFPETLVTGTYYRPGSKTFPAIDSFGVSSGSETLWFFQMKSAGLPPKTGDKAVKW
ncbi:unnamed protein product, partial [Pylaiella littoralis]